MGSIVFDSAVNSIFFGGTEIKKVYKGSTLIWEKQNSISVSSYTSRRSAVGSNFSVTVTSDVNWTATVTAGNSWASINKTSGSSGESVTITYTTNTSFSTRDASIKFVAGNAECYVSITQEAATPYFRVKSPTTFTFDYNGNYGSQSYATVNVETNIPWSSRTVYSKPDWCSFTWNSTSNTLDVVAVTTIQSDSTRSGNVYIGGTINGTDYKDFVTVVQNLPTDQSALSVYGVSGTTISNNTISVTSSGTGTSPKHICVDATNAWGSPGTFSIGWSAAISGLYIKKSTDSTWRQSGMSDVPSGTVIDIRVDSTDVTSTKTATLTISSGSKSYVLTIEQGAASKYLNLNTTNINEFAYGGASKTFSVDTNSDVSWSITDDRDWITISKTSGTGAYGPITVTTSSNPNISTRSGTVTVTGGGITKSFTVNQAAKPYLTVSPTSVSAASAARANKEVSVSSNTNWFVSTNDSWITLSSSSGSGSNSNYGFEIIANPSTSGRNGSITFSATDCSNQVVSVYQPGVPYSISISPTSASVGYTAGSGSFTVSSNDSWAVGHVAKGATGTKDGNKVNYTYPEYNPDNASGGYVTYNIPVYCTNDSSKTATFVITQSAPTISVSSSTLSLDGASGSNANSITVTSSGGWTATSNQDWLTVTGSGSSGAKPTFTANSANTGTSTRSATVTFRCGSASTTVTVTQNYVDTSISVNPSGTVYIGADANSYIDITVTSARDWTASGTSSGFSNNFTLSYPDTNKVRITAKNNNVDSYNNGTISISNGVNSATITVKQNYDYITPSPMPWTIASDAGQYTIGIDASRPTTWTASIASGSDWITGIRKPNTTTLEITATENTSTTNTRTGSITIVSGNKTITITLTQAIKETYWSVTYPIVNNQTNATVTNKSTAPRSYKFVCTVTRRINGNVVSEMSVTTGLLSPGSSEVVGTFPAQAGYSITVVVTDQIAG